MDFDEDSLNSYNPEDVEDISIDKDESGFEDVPNPKKKPPSETETETETKQTSIKIDIDSVDKLTGALRFASEKLDKSYSNITQSNINLLIEKLNKIDSKKVDDFYSNFQEKLNLRKIENSFNARVDELENKIENKIDKTAIKIDRSTKKLDEFQEVFENEEIYNTFDQIENVQKFLKSFKIKSTIIAAVLSSIITVLVSFFAMDLLYRYKFEQKTKELQNEVIYKNESVNKFFTMSGDFDVAEDEEVLQLQFKTDKLNLRLLPDNTKIIEVVK